MATRLVLVVLLAFVACPSHAQIASQCYRDEGCCVNGVQMRMDFFPMCQGAKKPGCILPGKAFLKARKACKAAFEK